MQALRRIAENGSELSPRPDGRGLSRLFHSRVALLIGVGAGVLLLLLLMSASAAAPAQASVLGIPNPLSLITGGIGSAIGGLAVGAFKAILHALFAPIANFVTKDVIGWLVSVPNFAPTGSHVAGIESTVAAMCAGALGAVATISVIRYWLTGLVSGSDGLAGIEGLAKTIGAALFIAIWPTWLFPTAIGLTNDFTHAILGSGAMQHNATMLTAALAGSFAIGGGPFGPLGLFIGIVVAVLSALLFLGLLLMKIVVAISTLLVFLGMPLAALLWPLTPWVMRIVSRVFWVCLMIPVIWAIAFAGIAALTLDTITMNQLTTGQGVLNAIVEPLLMLVLLYMLIRLPLHLSRFVGLGGMEIGGGFTHRMAEYTASRTAANAVQQHVPAKFGGRKPAGEGESGLGVKLKTAAKMAGFAAATGGVGAAPAAGSAAAGGAANARAAGTAARTAGSAGGRAGARGASNPRAYAAPPSAAARDRGVGLAPNGLQTPSFRQADFNNEMFEADHRSRSKANPVTVAQARSALASLPADTQKGVGHLVAEHGKEARQHLAYQATGEWLPEERDALRTLAAATPEVREQALAEAEKSGWVTGDTTVYEGTLEDTPPAEPTSNNGNGGVGSAEDPVDTVFNERDQVYEVPSASSGSGPGAASPSDGTPGDGPSFTGLDRSAAPKGPAPPPGSGRPTPRAIEAPRNQPPSRGD